jgi:hypothetical protein
MSYVSYTFKSEFSYDCPTCKSERKISTKTSTCLCEYRCSTCSNGHSWYFNPDKKETVIGKYNHKGTFMTENPSPIYVPDNILQFKINPLD